MSGKIWSLLNVGERLGLPDLERIAELGPRDAIDQLLQRFLVGDDAGASMYVLSGFEATETGTVITVARGVALAGYRDRGAVHHTALVADGEVDLSRDIDALSDGTYGVYIRLNYDATTYRNRPHWNPIASPPTEEIRSVPTQHVEAWTFAVEEVSPGAEWMKIYDVTKTGASLVLADKRVFFFEGTADNSFEPTNDWGDGANDRNGNRDLYGFFGIRRFVRAVQRSFEDVKGQAWWTALAGSASGSDGARNLTQLNDEKLARNGAQRMTGSLEPTPTDTINLGSATFRWLGAYLASATIAEWIAQFSASAGVVTRILTSSKTTGADQGTMRFFREMTALGSEVETLAITFNAYRTGVSTTWARDSNSYDSVKLQFSRTSFRLLIHQSTDGNTWTEATTAGDWTELLFIDLANEVFNWNGTAVFDNGLGVFNGDLVVGGGVITTDQDVHAGGDFIYDPPITVKLTVPGADLLNEVTGILVITVDDESPTAIAAGATKTGAGSAAALWAIQATNGAIVTAASIYGEFTSGAAKARAAIIRVHRNGGSVQSLNSAGYDTIETTVGVVEVPLTINQNATVDTDTYSYYLWVGHDAAGNDNTWSIYKTILDLEIDRTSKLI